MSEATPKKSSYKKLFSNTIIFAIGSFSSKILVLLLVKVYTTYLTPEELGINDVITQIANWLQPIVTMTISEAVIRFGLDKAYEKKSVFTIGNIICMCGFALLAVVLPIVNATGIADNYINGYALLLYVYVFMSGLKLVYSTFVRALEKVKLYAVNGILTTFFTLFGTILFLCGFKMGNTGYLLSIIMSDFLSVIFLTFTAKLWKYYDFKHIDREMLSVMLRYSIPLIPAQLLWLITNSSDSFMTTHYMGAEANGILSASYKIPNLVATVYLMFGQAWNMSAILEDDSDDRNEFYGNVFHLNQCLLYILAAGCLMIVQPLTKLWMGQQYWDSMRYSPILIYSSVFSCFTTFMGSIYLAAKETKRSLMTSLFSGIINVGLNIILIPTIGLYGPPISTVSSYLVVFIVRAYDSRKLVPFDLKIRKMIINNIILVAMVLINVLQFKFNSGVFSAIALPLLFIVVTALNFMPLWNALKHMLPAKFTVLIEKIGFKKLSLAGISAVVYIALCVLTKGVLFCITFIAVIASGMLFNRKYAIYGGVAGVFVSFLICCEFSTAIIATAVAMLVPLLLYRKSHDLIITALLADISIFLLAGAYLAVFCLMLELLSFVIVYRRQIMKSLEKILFRK